MLPVAVALALTVPAQPPDIDDVPVFAAPLRLNAGDAPMGNDQYYPSPELFDVDGDGVFELVVGDLAGNLRVSRPLSKDDPTAWSAPESLKRADGKDLKFHNW